MTTTKTPSRGSPPSGFFVSKSIMQEVAFNRNRLSRSTTVLPLMRFEDLETTSNKKLAAYRDFSLQLVKKRGHYDRIVATQSGKVVGNLTMGMTHGFVSSSIVMPEFKGQGLGLALYEAALKVYGHLNSSIDLSVGSSLIWKTLVERHNGCLVVPHIENYVIRSTTDVKVIGWKQGGKFWWPLVSKLGKPVSLQKLLESEDPREKASAMASYYKVNK